MKANRRAVNIENLIRFFSTVENSNEEEKYQTKRSRVFEHFEPEQILACIKLFDKDRASFELIAKYCRKYKQAAGEITIDELNEVRDALAVIYVHDR
jgi:hypothetical protein